MAYSKLIMVMVTQIIVGVGCYYLDQKTAFKKLPYIVRQIFYGLVFGGLSILGTEMGTEILGATLNLRDAAPLFAGLTMGGPAGIIAGLIGGVERWFAAAWGAGVYSQLACSVSTVLAGIFAALLRWFIFEKELISAWFYMALGVVMEVVHMLILFLTKMSDVNTAFEIVKNCVIPMGVLTGLTLFFQRGIIYIIDNRKHLFKRRKGPKPILKSFQRWLLVCILVAFVITTTFIWQLQTELSMNYAEEILLTNIKDVELYVVDASDKNLLNVTKKISSFLEKHESEISNQYLKEMMEGFDVSEINIVNKDGYIAYSSNLEFVGFNMRSGSQAVEFIKLLGDTTEYVQKYQPMSYDTVSYRKYAGVKIKDGFVQVGYDSNQFQEDIANQIKSAALNRHVGNSGSIIILDQAGNIVSNSMLSGYDGKNVNDIGVTLDLSKDTEKMFETNIFGTDYLGMYVSAEGYNIICVMPKSEMIVQRDLTVYITIFMEIIVFAVLFVLIYILIKSHIAKKMKLVNNGLSEITAGNLDVEINVGGSEEFATLSNDINQTVDTLKRYIAEASARIDKELEFAKSIQHSALPSSETFLKYGFDVCANMYTAKEVGGDFYDFYYVDERHLAFLVADVSGKGIPAAMFMMQAKSIIKNLAERKLPVNEVFTQANQKLCESNDAGMFVTAWMGIMDITTGLVKFANAGHNMPLVKLKNGQFEYLHSRPGFVLAGIDSVVYKEGELQLEPGDKIFLYTDGVTEANSIDEELYGDDRLHEFINTVSECDVNDICKQVKENVDGFVGNADQFDDITMLCFERKELPDKIG